MFQAVMSASVIGWPARGDSASAVAVPNVSMRTTAESDLRVDMLDPPGAVDTPTGDAVVVLVRERQRARHRLLGLPASSHELGAQRLHVAGLVPGAALQHHRLAIPAPWHPEAGESLRIDRALQRRLRPALAAVGRDRDLGDAAVAGIGDPGDLVLARSLQ